MKRIVGFLGVAVLALCTPLAQATIQISYQLNGGVLTTCAANGTDGTIILCPAFTDGLLTVTGLQAFSNSPGTATQSKQTSAAVDITNAGASTQVIELFFVAENFTSPVGPPSITFLSHIGGSVATGAVGSSLLFKSCVINGTNLLPCGAAGSITNIGTPSITATGSFQDDQIGVIPILDAGYSIGEDLLITLAPGGSVNFAASTTLSPVPEPMSIALLGGVLLLTSRMIMRKKGRVS